MKYSFNTKSIVRTPVFPIKQSFSIDELQELFTRTKVKEALFLSSPDLLEEFNKWEKSGFKPFEKQEKLVHSLLKYATRMHSRCTPFGLFAGCNMINQLQHEIKVNPLNGERKTRLDMNFSGELASNLARLSFIKNHLLFYPNTSLYTVKNQIRYVEYLFKNKKRDYQITAVDNSVYIQRILQQAQNGAKIQNLASCLVEDDISINEATEFVEQIIESQLLVSELEPGVSGMELVDKILMTLQNIQNQNPSESLKSIIEIISSIQQDLEDCDSKMNNSTIRYFDIIKKIEALGVSIDLSKLFQTDFFPDYELMENEKDGMYQKKVEKQLMEAILVLNKMTYQNEPPNLVEFTKKFRERYEDQEIPLLQVLDTESGIGYAQNTNRSGDVNPLVDGVILPGQIKETVDLKWREVYSVLLKKLVQASKESKLKVSLSSEELPDEVFDLEGLPNSVAVMYNLLDEKNDSPMINLRGISGSSGINLLGRFAQGNEAIYDFVKNIAQLEQEHQSGEVVAEIVHLPENRTGNVLLRPVFREYEIPYLSSSVLPKEKQIGLSDLMVSVRSNKVILRSKRLGKVVRPMLGNAHNYSNKSLPVYHFLCDLQNQNKKTGMQFNWGPLSNRFSFLPRVEVGNVIVSRATWNVSKSQIKELLDERKQVLDIVADWREKHALPQFVLLVEGDNELLINLKDALSVGMFLNMIKKKNSIILKEFLFNSSQSVVKDQEGNGYTNEVVSILQKIKEDYANVEVNREKKIPNRGHIQREFSVGSEWIYLKLYCGVKTSDKILVEIIKPLIENMLQEGLIDSWFFIRYSDPELHIRVRFHLTDLSHLGGALQQIQYSLKEYQESGMLWKVQADTYAREIERYGARTMVLSESMFFNDSMSIINLMDNIEGYEGENIRWLFGIRAVDELLVSFSFTTNEKMELMNRLALGFGKEFGMNKGLKRQLDKRFRANRKKIVDVLDRDRDVFSELNPLFKLLKVKNERNKLIIAEILEIERNGDMGLPLNDFISSHIHMLLNRLFRNKQRVHEMVIYDFLWRTYRSEIAQQKNRRKVVNV